MALLLGAALLTNVFGKQGDVGGFIQNFDFSKMDVRDETKDDYCHTQLAPSFGKLNKTNLAELDEKLKIMIAGTMKTLAKQTDKSWPAVVAAMTQNPLLEPDATEIARADKLIKSGVSAFKFDGSPDHGICREVNTWFVNLIKDDDVLQSTKIDINVLARIVAQTGAAIETFEQFFAKNARHEKTMIDIGVLRFPDIDRPYFKLYRIKVSAWSDCSRILFVQEDKNGITGEFNSRIFRPRASVMAGMTDDARKKAIQEANAMFD